MVDVTSGEHGVASRSGERGHDTREATQWQHDEA
jgi:hypothetical protein